MPTGAETSINVLSIFIPSWVWRGYRTRSDSIGVQVGVQDECPFWLGAWLLRHDCAVVNVVLSF